MRKEFLFLGFVFFVLVITTPIIAQENPVKIDLIQGKNNITTNFCFSPIYVKTLAAKYPEINSVTYQEYEKTIGYVNVFGGIGQNFPIMQNQTYEIIVKENITIELE